MRYSQTHSPIINQTYPHHLILLPLALHHLLLTIPRPIHIYPLLKETSLPPLLLMHQMKKEVVVKNQVKMRAKMTMSQA